MKKITLFAFALIFATCLLNGPLMVKQAFALQDCAHGLSCAAYDPNFSVSGGMMQCHPPEYPADTLAFCCPAGTEIVSTGGPNVTCLDLLDDHPSTPPTQPLTQETIDSLNPLKIPEFQDPSVEAGDLSTPRGILNRVLQFAFPLAGLILFVMLVWAGFEIVTGATEKKSLDAGRQRATAAIIGFLLLFISYWIIQVLQVMFNLTIL